jgi:hypothetical protein
VLFRIMSKNANITNLTARSLIMIEMIADRQDRRCKMRKDGSEDLLVSLYKI